MFFTKCILPVVEHWLKREKAQWSETDSCQWYVFAGIQFLSLLQTASCCEHATFIADLYNSKKVTNELLLFLQIIFE